MSRLIPLLLLPLLCLSACHSVEDFDDTRHGNFEALWTAVDQHYCFFAYKDVDWQEVHDRYYPQVKESMTKAQLFELCSAMLDELRDGHTNLSSGFATSYYRAWWSDYPQNFDSRLVEQYYFNYHYTQLGSWWYAILPQNVAYLRVPTFSSGLGHSNIDWALYNMLSCTGLIIDLRDNGGGEMTNAQTLIQHFISTPTTVGYISHKTGTAHDAFSEPYPISLDPAPEGSMIWGKPVVLLTNRSTYSAANFFVMAMRGLPGVTHVGACTGGGAGMPYSSELPCGWGLRMSASIVYDSQMNITEFGIEPTAGCAVDLDSQAALSGTDTMLDFAINLITQQ
jgi:hypothetical protein